MRGFAWAVAALMAATLSVAADRPEYGPIPDWVQPADASVIAGVPPTDAAVRVLLQGQQFNLAPAADEGYFENVARIQTPQGLSAMGTITLPWKPETDTLTIHKLHILRGDTVIDVLASGQTFTVLRRENNLENAALDGVLTAVIQPADLRVGDTVSLAYSQKRTDPILGGVSEQTIGNWQTVPIAHVRVRARWAKSTPVRWQTRGAISGVKETRIGDFTELTLALDDVEPLMQPKGAPARFSVDRQIELSGNPNWAAISRKLAPLYTRAAKLTAQSPLHAEIARIRAAAPDDKARAEAALALVQDQVRYVFLGMNDGDLVPADADVTWSRRFGDCKGKTALLLALLSGLGIDADPVAVSVVNGDGLDARLPMVGLFDHVLVRARIGGKTYWLDGTRTSDRRLERIGVPAFRWGLPLVSRGSELVPMVTEPLTEPTSTTSIRIDASAGIEAPAPFQVETTLSGDEAELVKVALSNAGASNAEQALRTYWSKVYDSVDIKSVSSQFDAHTGEARLSMKGEARLDWRDKRYRIDGLQVGYYADFSRPPSPNGDAPFAVAHPQYVRTTKTIVLPRQEAGRYFVDGDDIQRVVAGVEYRRKARIRNGVFEAEVSMRSVAPEFPAAEADAAQKTLRELATSSVHVKVVDGFTGATREEVDAEIAATLTTAESLIERGRLMVQNRMYDRALKDFDSAIALDPASAAALAERGAVRLLKSQFSLARADLDKALAMDPRNPVALRGRGTLAFNAGDRPAEVVSAFTTLLEIQPGDAEALDKRARAHAQLGDNANALADSAELIRLGRRSFETYALRIGLLRKEGRIEDALREVEALVAFDHVNPLAQLVAAETYAAYHRDEEARAAFDRLVEMSPDQNGYVPRANYRRKTDPAGAKADIEAALARNPKAPAALFVRSGLEYDAGDYATAAATLSQMIRIQGPDWQLLTARGLAYFKNGQADLARGDFAAARSQARQPTVLNSMCWTIATSGTALEEGLASCDAALAAEPENSSFHDSRGLVLLRLERHDDAILAYDAALKNRPSSASSLYGRGIARKRKGDALAGEADIRAALAADPLIHRTYEEFGVQP